MAAVYYLGCKEVETKKGDRVVAFLLCHDSYRSPVVRDFWLNDGSEIADTVRNLMPGCAVICATVFGDERSLARIAENPDPDIPLLDLTAFLDTSIN